MIALQDVLAAREAIAGRVHLTPAFGSDSLARRVGARVLVKAECLQKTGSFKARGVLNRLRFLSEAERRRGLITYSAGNHGQALAWGARQAGLPCTVVMPAEASPSKVAAAEGYGATVVLHGDSVSAYTRMLELQAERGLILVHPYDDEQVIAGQGTVGLEVLEQASDVTKVVVPIGGGGLIAGTALAARSLRPSVKVYGVEPAGADSMFRSRAAGRAVRLDRTDTIADGLAAPFAGEAAFHLVEKYVDDVVTVTDEQIVLGLREVLARCKLVVEPAGAAGVAALLAGKIPLDSADVVVAVLSGGNLDLTRLKDLL
jgi:threonine dehydratase